MLVVFIGPPGSGKGTQAERLAAKLQLPHLSTGAMLREAADAGSEPGRRAMQFMEHGHLAPDELVIAVIGERIAQPDCARGCLFDGFPRTIEQARALDQLLLEGGRTLDHVLELDVAEAELVQRLLRRAKTSDPPRTDDTPEVIPERIEVYRRQTTPVLEYYRERGLLRTVDGQGAPEEVFVRVCDTVGYRGT